ncbi:MAG: 50S ribosomal protein L4 [Elusimicrobia bacterium RIFCSPLOWO2_01_FULL_59_12]|nr:MAG: 50S ribosomal protein L4 [Elusimicrobia bacterium RIFCSPLOWO2_01_FULL_59_12]
MEVPFISTSGDAKGKVELPAAIFAQEGSKRVLQESLIAFLANQRRGTSDTKTRADVSGGGHKPWRQKGTGNARAGSNRSPLWRKGGIIFGPHPRSYRKNVDAFKRRVALATALSIKAQDQTISILESLPEGDGKTSAMNKFFSKAAPAGRVLVIVDKKSDLLRRAVRNLEQVNLADVRELNPWTLMNAQKVLVTQAALQALNTRFPQGAS